MCVYLFISLCVYVSECMCMLHVCVHACMCIKWSTVQWCSQGVLRGLEHSLQLLLK